MKTKRLTALLLAVLMLIGMSAVMFDRVTADSGVLALKKGSTLTLFEQDGVKYVSGIPEQLSAPDFTINFKGTITLTDAEGNTADGYVGTAFKAALAGSSDFAYAIVKADVNGSGTINVTDYLQIKRHILKTFELTGVYNLAADVDSDGKVDQTDLILVKRHFIKISVIASDFTNDALEDEPTTTAPETTTSETEIVTTTTLADDEIDPTVPGKQGMKFLVVAKINKYSTAANASAMVSATGTVSPGVYYIYTKYPNGYAGCYNITTDTTGGSAGFWVNPLENTSGDTSPSNVMYMLPSQTSQQSMCFVIRTAGDKLILIDSGNTGDGTYIMNFLKLITGSKTPHVDAWFFSHAHSDHVNGVNTIATTYADSITIDKFYYDFYMDEEWYDERSLSKSAIKKFKTTLSIFSDTESVIVKEGDKFVFDDYTFDILLTKESGYEIPGNYLNNTSTIIRMTIGEQTVLFLGDAGVEEGAFLLSKYGSALKSDFVQMAHHGQAGVEKNVYEAIMPTACLWCAPAWLYNNTNGLYKTLETRAWMEELGVKYHFVDMDGLQTIKFPYVFEEIPDVDPNDKSYITKTENGVIYSFDTQTKFDDFNKDCYAAARALSSKAYSNEAMRLIFVANADPYYVFNLTETLDFAEYPVIAVYSKYDLKDGSGKAYTHTADTFFTDIRPCGSIAGGSIIMREAAYVNSAKAATYQKLIYDYSDGKVYNDKDYTPSGTIRSVRYDPAADALSAVNTTVYIKYIGFFKTLADAEAFEYAAK